MADVRLQPAFPAASEVCICHEIFNPLKVEIHAVVNRVQEALRSHQSAS
jgi:hypothetical protein